MTPVPTPFTAALPLAEATTAAAPAIPMQVWLPFLALAAFMSLYSLFRIHVRRQRWPLRHRLFWSLVVPLPFVGPMLYALLFERFPSSAWTDREASGWGLSVDRGDSGGWLGGGGGGSDDGGGWGGGGCGGGGGDGGGGD